MKKLILVFAMFVFAIMNLFADGFVDPKEFYYYRVNTEINLIDQASQISPNVYVAVLYPDSTNWIRISDTLTWDRNNPNEGVQHFNFIPDVITNNATLGMFVNPDGIWDTIPVTTFITDIITSSGTFTHYPQYLFDEGTGYISWQLNPIQLPPTIVLEYSNNNVDWKNVYTDNSDINVSDGNLNYNINKNVYLENTWFRVVYPNTSIVICSTDEITYLESAWFDFGATQKTDNVITLDWSKSENFDKIYIIKKLNDVLVDTDSINTLSPFDITLNQIGIWEITGKVQDGNFSRERSYQFEIGDPCKEIVDSLNSVISMKNDTILYLNIQITNLYDIIDSLGSLPSDTLIVIINNDSTNITEVPFRDFKELADDSIKGPFTMFLFDLNGKEIKNNKGNGFWYPSESEYLIINCVNESAQDYRGMILVFITKTEGTSIIIDKYYKYMKE